MHITNGQFVSILLESGHHVDDLFHHLTLSEQLIKQHGKLLFLDEVLIKVKDVSEDLYHFLLVLKQSKKHNLADIKRVFSLLKKEAGEYAKDFRILADSQDHQKQIAERLQQKFDNIHVDHHVVEGEEVFVSGDGWYYKRGVEQDAKRVLGL